MPPPPPSIRFVDLLWRGVPLRLEYSWIGVAESAVPTVVFLHEGLGSLSLWKDFPENFCTAHGLRGLVFSRYGYGRSTPRPAAERWPTSFMHAQATEVLPALFSALAIERPWLFGHSDGGSIALLYAAAFPQAASGVIAVAPHIFVEDVTIANIELAKSAYRDTGLRTRLARHHADPDSAFFGWNDVWLDPAFRAWNIEQDVTTITCPVLAIQGEQDEYGTLDQIHGIRRKVPQTQVVSIAGCGHSPHRDQPSELGRAAARFISGAC